MSQFPALAVEIVGFTPRFLHHGRTCRRHQTMTCHPKIGEPINRGQTTIFTWQFTVHRDEASVREVNLCAEMLQIRENLRALE